MNTVPLDESAPTLVDVIEKLSDLCTAGDQDAIDRFLHEHRAYSEELCEVLPTLQALNRLEPRQVIPEEAGADFQCSTLGTMS